MFLNIILTIIAGAFFAEFAGYFIHKLLHSEKIEFLSRNHMIHHLKNYGPRMHQRPTNRYIYSTEGRASVARIGLEWIVPIGAVCVAIMVGLWLLRIPLFYRLLFIAVSSGWGLLMFNYVHDRLHVKDFWMEKHPLFKKRFLKARKLHDIHHMELTDDGRMTKNYGICFFFFDVLFGSLGTKAKAFNKHGFESAQERYSYIYDAMEKQ